MITCRDVMNLKLHPRRYSKALLSGHCGGYKIVIIPGKRLAEALLRRRFQGVFRRGFRCAFGGASWGVPLRRWLWKIPGWGSPLAWMLDLPGSPDICPEYLCRKICFCESFYRRKAGTSGVE